jgi:PHP family Zn ribbon phosphoesterase
MKYLFRPNPDGKISLKESLGNNSRFYHGVPLVEQENPNVVAIYKELHSKGLNIIGVSDKDKAKWKEAIAKDN